MSVFRGHQDTGDSDEREASKARCNMGHSKVMWGSPPWGQFPPAYSWKSWFVFIKKNGLPGPPGALNKSVVEGSRSSHASWGEREETPKSH